MSDHRRPDLDRLSPGDISNLRVEDHGLPMPVAALLLLDAADLFDADGTFRLDALASEIERRLDAVPRLRQVLRTPRFGSGRPLWIDDERFDIARHVRALSIPAPGDEAAMLSTCAQLNRARLDRSRPLWEVWFLTGLADGRVAMLIRLHHAIADGIASVAMLGALLGGDADATDGRPWVAREPPTSAEIFEDNLRRRGTAFARAIDDLIHPARWVPNLVSTATGLRRIIDQGRAPRSSLNAAIGARRLLFLARADLGSVKAAAHRHGGTVNDVILAAVAGGARSLLERRGELVSGLELRASVPVSRRGAVDPAATGNRVAVMIVPLPVGEPDPIDRLERIVHVTTALKRDRASAMGWDVGSPLLQRVVARWMKRQRVVNLLLSNVPGPQAPISVGGARVLEAFQIGVIQGNVTLAVGALSYAGHLTFDVVADADACPDADVFVDGLRATLDELVTGTAPSEAG